MKCLIDFSDSPFQTRHGNLMLPTVKVWVAENDLSMRVELPHAQLHIMGHGRVTTLQQLTKVLDKHRELGYPMDVRIVFGSESCGGSMVVSRGECHVVGGEFIEGIRAVPYGKSNELDS